MYEIYYTTTDPYHLFPHSKGAYLPAWVLPGKYS